MTDAGMIHLGGLVDLDDLSLAGTKVTDARIGPFDQNKGPLLAVARTHAGNGCGAGSFEWNDGIGELDLRANAGTDKGVEQLQKSLPKWRDPPLMKFPHPISRPRYRSIDPQSSRAGKLRWGNFISGRIRI